MKSRILWLLVFAGAFFSCKKREGNIIIDGQGQGLGYDLIRTDTFSLEASTIREDSLPGNGLPYSLIGFMNDPVLGKTRANVFASIILNAPASDFPNTLTPDSAILFIPIINGLNFYGDKNAVQQWDIHPLISQFSSGSVYYQSDKPDYDKNVKTIWSGNAYPNSSDSFRHGNGKLGFKPGIRIKLSAEMAKQLMQMPKDAYKSDDELKKYFPGLAILPQDNGLTSGEGGIGVYGFSSVGVLGSRASVFLYYNDTSTFVFNFAASSRIVTTAQTGPYPTEVTSQLNDSTKSFPMTWVQALNGLKTWVRIPGLLNISNAKNVAVNRAQITFYLKDTLFSSEFMAPPRLNLFRPAGKGSNRNFVLSDGNNLNFGGVLNEAKGTYTFNITRHVQDLMNDYFLKGENNNLGLYLSVPTAEPVLATRAAIDHTKTRFEITYTKLN